MLQLTLDKKYFCSTFFKTYKNWILHDVWKLLFCLFKVISQIKFIIKTDAQAITSITVNFFSCTTLGYEVQPKEIDQVN